jgi:outer membrane receptor protein involved in Fe transport
MRFRASLLAALVIALCFGMGVYGQVGLRGTLKGAVADANSAFVPSATVTAKNEATGLTSTAVTDSEGNYTLADLLPGNYTVTVEKQGYKKTVKTGVNVAAGTVTSNPITLEIGSVSETVTVTGNEEALQTETSQISGTIGTRKVEELPSNGASGGIDTLALLIPGVVGNRAGGTNTNGTGLSVNGNRGRTNNFQIDGQDNNDLSVGGPALFVDFLDSVQEFQVVTSNFSAQYGRNQGAIVNIVTKSGTNDFHGSAFEWHRDNYNLDSLTNTEKRSGQLKPNRDMYNVFGGTIGGPVPIPHFGENGGPEFISGKNRAFFYFGYQGVREPSSNVVRTTAMAIQANQFGRLASTYPGNGIVAAYTQFSPFAIAGTNLNTFSTAGQAFGGAQMNLNAPAGCTKIILASATPAAGCGTYSVVNNPSTGQPFLIGGPYDVLNLGTATAPDLYQVAQYEHPYNFSYNEDYWELRGDIRPTKRDSASVRYISQTSASLNGTTATAGGFHGDLPAHSKNLGGDWTHQFTNAIANNFRLSRQQIGVEFGGGCAVKTPGCVPGPADIGVSLANIGFSFAAVNGSAIGTIGAATNLPQGRISTVHQIADTLTWVKGRQTWTMGAEYKWLSTITPFLPNFDGAFAYNATTRFTNNAPSSYALAVGDPLVNFPEHDQYYFFQDDWKVKPNLTLNLGVRYEFTGQPINALHDESVARESSSSPLFNPSLPLSQRTVPLTPSDKNNWAPRLGFAYTPHFWKAIFGQDATVFRGGYSIAYDIAFYNILLNVANAAPFSASLSVPSVSLVNAPGTVYALPGQPYGDVLRANAASSGLLPTGVLNPIYLAQTNVDPNFYSPYSEQWSFGVQRQFGRRFIAEATYLGTHGVGLFQNINNNFFTGPLVNGFTLTKSTNGSGGFAVGSTCNPSPTQTCISFPSFANLLPAGTTAQVCTDISTTLDNEAACNGRQFRAGGITTRTNQAQSMYHSLQTRFSGRFLNDDLNVGAGYTWSKSIDDASEIFAFGGGDIASPNAQNPFCVNSCERGLSSFDRTHVLSTNFIFDFPWMKEQHGIIGKIAGGWQLNGIYLLTSGAPYTPNDNLAGTYGLGATYLTAGDRPFLGNSSVDPRQVGISQIDAFFVFGIPIQNANGFWSMNDIRGRNGAVSTLTLTPVSPNDVHFIINGPGAAKLFNTPFGSVGRSTERGPIFNQLNLSLFKNIRVTERVKIQLRGEAINALNHPNPGFGTGSGGAIPQMALTNAGVRFSAYGENSDIGFARRVIQVAFRLSF